MEDTKTDTPEQLQQIKIGQETYYRISNVDKMRPFFMSIVSDSNHWMFISSNGGLSAGRIDADHALFPYYTDDKITESNELTGGKTVFRFISENGQPAVWEPFSSRFEGLYQYSRNLYKNLLGNKILFEEINHDLGLTFRYQWNTSDQYGFVRESTLINHGNSVITLEVIDGIQNIMPYGVPSDIQFIRSNLVDAYKRSELEVATGLGIYALSAIIVDRAEPSEALKANVAWSVGLDNPTYLLCSSQIAAFRKGEQLNQETDVKAERGAYLTYQNVDLAPDEQKQWMIVADVNKSASEIARINREILNSSDLISDVRIDIERGATELSNLTAASDSTQLSNDELRNTRHYSNTLFNIMRGGIFDDNYQIDRKDFVAYLKNANREVFEKSSDLIDQLPESFPQSELVAKANGIGDKDLIRLAVEYLPLKFSRRHGDPSRPWNRFSINTKDESGEKVLDYEGNWRDIFQNWEALAHSYPEFIEGMIFKFLNASTFDGYNPYRVTKDGFDWEIIEENDPWSYIGYWGDHQIIYLQKFLEFIEGHYPGKLAERFNQDLFVFANVPYKIKPYQEILKDPKDTIVFDDALDHKIREQRDQRGADGALLQNAEGTVVRVNLMEKLLVTALAKVSNLIPEGGIWMNTQRPEWNDANNALVGNGVSMVTLCYLRRFFQFFEGLLLSSEDGAEFVVSSELSAFYKQVSKTLSENESILSGEITDGDRKGVMDGLGNAGSEYRESIYHQQHSGNSEAVSSSSLRDFTQLILKYLDQSIKANKRADGMYHAYNIMALENESEVSIAYLSEMLEGQVAVLSSGKLTPKESLEVLDGLKASTLFREDQFSYILYPNKELSKFLVKNIIPEEQVASSSLLKKLVTEGNIEIIEKDVNGEYHFNGKFTNAAALDDALSSLSKFKDLVSQERDLILRIFEDVFNHKAFTGRSGTFFGYEGLGSIYWHMVSKLLLAAQESCLSAMEQGADQETVGRLIAHYYEINEGIGVHKSPDLYGAFPTDPYSHTPYGKGVQQPGMTGQVKEDILSRIGELGVFVKGGSIHFEPSILQANELIEEGMIFNYVDLNREPKSIELPKNSLAFTYCQIPIVYQLGDVERLEIQFEDGTSNSYEGLIVNSDISQDIFKRNRRVVSIRVTLKQERLI